jgi:Overcoming lysogenization defect protein-like, TOPRIM domain
MMGPPQTVPELPSKVVAPPPDGIVVVEGESDRVALVRLAERKGRDLAAEGIDVVPIGGAHALSRFLASLGALGQSVKLAGLCDAGEAEHFRRALGPEAPCYVCDVDLEDELVRAVGAARVEKLIGVQGELHSFRTLQKQPFQRSRTLEQQLRVFLGNRKIRYASLLVDALDLSNVPRPLDGVLAYV